jgi:hypothetical protein
MMLFPPRPQGLGSPFLSLSTIPSLSLSTPSSPLWSSAPFFYGGRSKAKAGRQASLSLLSDCTLIVAFSFTSIFFFKIDTIILLFVFHKYCPIID